MKDTIYHLSTCNTCQRIIGDLSTTDGITIQNIRDNHISADVLDYAKEQTGSYESLFNKRAMKYRSQGLKEMTLSESDWRKYILSEYTFLKRPLCIINGEVFAGNAKKTVAALKIAVDGRSK